MSRRETFIRVWSSPEPVRLIAALPVATSGALEARVGPQGFLWQDQDLAVGGGSGCGSLLGWLFYVPASGLQGVGCFQLGWG
jgi:hypothetical protein